MNEYKENAKKIYGLKLGSIGTIVLGKIIKILKTGTIEIGLKAF